jgi:acetyl esterase/lipase
MRGSTEGIMALHPQCKAFLDVLASAGGPPLHELPVAEARKISLTDFGGVQEPMAHVEDRVVPGPGQPIRVRVYRPVATDNLPVLTYFHGGGFVICNLDSHDRECRRLAKASGCAVVSVDYRLAPEHPFPAAAEDAYAATRHIAEHAAAFNVDPTRIAVAGDSAGGNLATVVALMARDRGGPALRFQLLIYPTTDWTDSRSPSLREYGSDHFLTLEAMHWFADQYLPRAEDRRSPYASPMFAEDLRGLPPAMVITAECDPIRDQGEAYARKLQAAGVPVELKRYNGMIHPFFSLAGIIDSATVAAADAGSAVRNALASSAASV